MNQNIKTLTLNAIALLVAILLIWKATSILIYLLISCGLAIIGNNIADAFEKIKIKKKTLPRWLSALLIIILFYSVFIISLQALLPIFDQQAETLSNINFEQLLLNLQEPIQIVQLKIRNWTGDQHFDLLTAIKIKASSTINFSTITSWLETATSLATDILFGMFTVTFITFFLIKDGKEIYNKLILLLPEKSKNKIENIIASSLTQLRKYFIGVGLETLILVVVLSIALWAAGVQQYFIIALIAALLNIIPYIGPISAMAIAAMIIIAGNYSLPFETDLLPLLTRTIVIMIIVHFIDSMILQPYIYSSSVNAHPLEIFLVILISGNIGGIFAMIFAIPTYSILRIVVSEFKQKETIE
jgi:predicted PurR-regulated permease PerM